MGHIIDRGHSISAGVSALSKLNARCRLYDPSRTVVDYVIQVCTCRKRPPRFQTNMRVTKSTAMCRIEMKRCRFGVQNGVFTGAKCCAATVLDYKSERHWNSEECRKLSVSMQSISLIHISVTSFIKPLAERTFPLTPHPEYPPCI